MPQFTTNHTPAFFQFCQVLHAGNRWETARAQTDGVEITAEGRATDCPRLGTGSASDLRGAPCYVYRMDGVGV